MRRATCPRCEHPVFFDSLRCEVCRTGLAHAPDDDRFVGGVGAPGGPPTCANRAVLGCNWLPDVDGPRCRSCRLDVSTSGAAGTSPASTVPFHAARRRVLRWLLALDLDLTGPPALAFDLRHGAPGQPVTTGHRDGVITLDTAEADPAARARLRTELGERYRTPLGHVRHETGHWFWAAGVDRAFDVADFRNAFGDERADYAAALDAHYATADDGSWRDAFVSRYASSHPWEDFAESWAHLLHLLDTLETAVAHGLVRQPTGDFDDLWSGWTACTVALNELNRSMGTDDPFPFVVAPPAVEKIRFVARAVGLRPDHLRP